MSSSEICLLVLRIYSQAIVAARRDGSITTEEQNKCIDTYRKAALQLRAEVEAMPLSDSDRKALQESSEYAPLRE